MVYTWYILPIGGLYGTDPTYYGPTKGTRFHSIDLVMDEFLAMEEVVNNHG